MQVVFTFDETFSLSMTFTFDTVLWCLLDRGLDETDEQWRAVE